MTCWQISMTLPAAASLLPPQLMLQHSRICLQQLISGCRRQSSSSVKAQQGDGTITLDEASSCACQSCPGGKLQGQMD